MLLLAKLMSNTGALFGLRISAVSGRESGLGTPDWEKLPPRHSNAVACALGAAPAIAAASNDRPNHHATAALGPILFNLHSLAGHCQTGPAARRGRGR